jgi:hypothetical protein
LEPSVGLPNCFEKANSGMTADLEISGLMVSRGKRGWHVLLDPTSYRFYVSGVADCWAYLLLPPNITA